MKRLSLVAIISCFCFVLAACGSGDQNNKPSAESKTSAGQSAEAAEQNKVSEVYGDYPVGIFFGDWSDDPDLLILNERSTFTGDESISLGMEIPERFGVKTITINLYQADNGQLLDSWDDSVDPDWESLAYEFQVPEEDGMLDPGEYEVAVFKDTTRIGEGRFVIE